MGKKSKAPKAPDYVGAAQAQAAGDLQQAKYQTALDRITQRDPYGSVGWHFQGYDINNPQPGDWVQTTSLSPQQQAIANAEQYNALHLQNLGSQAIGQASNTLASNFNPWVTDFRDPSWATIGANRVGLPNYTGWGFNQQNTLTQFGNLDENVDRYNSEAAKALYDKQTQFMGERFGQETDAERSRLAAMGLQEGTEAYSRALDQMQRNQNSAYQTAALDATLKGYDVGTQNLNNLLGTRASNLALQQGIFDQQLAGYGANQQERLNIHQAGAQNWGLDLADRQARADNELAMANQAAAQRNQQFQEAAYKRSLPINEIAALLSGGGVTMPQFTAYAPAAQSRAADILGATQAQYNAQMGAYNARQQQKGNLLGAGVGLAGSFLGGK